MVSKARITFGTIVSAIAGLGLAACEIDDGGSSAPPPGQVAQGFTYYGPGDLQSGSGTGVEDRTVYAPGIRFPIASHPTYLNSQVWGFGGGQGEAGAGWCDARNYQMPWRDNFCETRSGADRETLNCPSRAVHQGQDIRAGSSDLCNSMRVKNASDRTDIPVVATEDGYISYIGTYTVNLRAGERIYRYMHMNMSALQVSEGDPISAGETIGYLSNDFGGTATTLHLHMELKQNIDGVGWTWVSPYMSLVRAYERRENGVGVEVTD
ncbi:MAG: M23 family metallopeptidase [Maricaulaceae bacterium]|jgi:murein DD-endopeptidase MepM/ murein hydrolase activator NlpD